jgi:SAM-dependent methyltransferase
MWLSGWSPTPRPVLRQSLRLAELRAGDLLYDLGCGDGRVIVTAAREFGAQAVGFDIDPSKVRLARARIRRFDLDGAVEVRRQNAMKIADLDLATVVFLYLEQRGVNRLRRVLRQRCSPGTRIVSVSSWLYGWPAERTLSFRGQKYRWWIGLWRV